MKLFPSVYRQILLGLMFVAICGHSIAQQKTEYSGNPVIQGWNADPEAKIFEGQYWIYPTYSAPYDEQVHMDAWSSKDLVHWTKHPDIIDTASIKWAKRAMWAPAVTEMGGKYYFFFGANDIHDDKKEIGGIGVGVSDKPEGPFKDYLGKPLIGKIYNGAQPIDQFIFKDKDGQYYIIYGGWQHCNIAKLNKDFTGFIPFDDGVTYKSITPQDYVEGSVMFTRKGKYYLMWSEGGWGGPNYRVAYAMSNAPTGPFKRIGVVLQQDPRIATGAGHHSVIQIPGTDEWYIVYHRRPLTETDANHRVTCIDHMYFDADGFIKPVHITNEGVAAVPLK
ncbi:Glycosyl hydrolases family 43 [Mucilaginibacter mallensis]|uniref:Glycosyl hydrolases family 43 n=1 Tax=Mucilaginibacter mallensis TaxID=652787 RepID=A0A1H1ULU0_MUCMA|nr:glycoside hydrolase family 43 protein [Mucilaginibacter mallensis]SDS73487.1 Glycosyl hydrolases family 43 [Mucilaginibacter mallensis]